MVTVRPLREDDLEEADRICRLAFGTFLGLPDPMKFMGDAQYVRTRWRADPEAALAAEMDGSIVGSNFATFWGKVAFFGPLTIRPELWDRGIAGKLLERTMEIFAERKAEHLGLFTFSQSPKHVSLYQKFGFWPRFLTAILARTVEAGRATVRGSLLGAERDREAPLRECRELTEAIYPGLDLGSEISATMEQGLGETLLVREAGELAAFAVCHLGAGSEAGSGTGYVKFGAARPGPGAAERFERLLDACEALVVDRGMSTLVAGMNLAREEAYRRMRARGYRALLQGVAMYRPNEPGYGRPDRFVIDDWR